MHWIARFSLFLTITWTVLFGLHYYIWARLIRDTGVGYPWRGWLTVLLALLGVLIPLGMIFHRFAPPFLTKPLMWAVYSWLGMAFFLNVLLGLVDLVKILTVTLPLAFQGRALDPDRRRFLAMLSGGLVLLGGFGMSAVAFFGATAAAIRVKRVKVALANLGASLEGYRIVQISDVHVGPTIGRDFVETIVREINALQPDLVAITGDLVDGTLSQLRDQVEPLKDLKAKDGVFFVTGNHEYYTGDVDEWLSWLSGIGIRPLCNERVEIRGGFDLAGTEDISARGEGHRQDIPKALAGRKTARPVVLLAHQPHSFAEAARLGVDLQLTGHTHGGQIYPFNYLVGLFQPYVSGLHQKGKSQIYVSCGTGYWGPPMRLGAPAEITEIELQKG